MTCCFHLTPPFIFIIITFELLNTNELKIIENMEQIHMSFYEEKRKHLMKQTFA